MLSQLDNTEFCSDGIWITGLFTESYKSMSEINWKEIAMPVSAPVVIKGTFAVNVPGFRLKLDLNWPWWRGSGGGGAIISPVNKRDASLLPPTKYVHLVRLDSLVLLMICFIKDMCNCIHACMNAYIGYKHKVKC